MDILNRTAYNTDDFHNFIVGLKQIRETPWVELPSEVLLGYSSEPGNYGTYKYVAGGHQRHGIGPYRIGFVKPAQLYDSPLQALAASAQDELDVPLLFKRELANLIMRRVFDYCPVGTHAEPLPVDMVPPWDRLADLKLRYELKKLPLSKEQRRDLKLRLEEHKLAELEKRRHEIDSQIYRYERRLRHYEALLDTTMAKISHQQQKIREISGS